MLIDALLDDGDAGAAWAAAEGNRAVTPEQWLRLADAVAADRPADALGVYRRAIDQLRTMTGNDVYHRLAACCCGPATATWPWAPARTSAATWPPSAPTSGASAR